MIQARLRDDAVVKVIEIDRRKEVGVFGGRLVFLHFWESTHAGRSEADAGVVALRGVICGIDGRVTGVEEGAGCDAVGKTRVRTSGRTREIEQQCTGVKRR